MGRPTLLTPARADALVQAIANGAAPTRASKESGVSHQVIQNWLRRGETERQRLATLTDDDHAPGTLHPTETLYLEFLERVENAMREWEQAGLEAIRMAGVGEEFEDSIVTEVTRPNGDKEVTVVVRKRVTKSWQAWAWLLERRMPDVYARVSKTEMTGAAGGPVQIASIEEKRERALALLDELARRRQINEAKALSAAAVEAVADADVADAEIVDETGRAAEQ